MASYFDRFTKFWGINGGLEIPSDTNANAGMEFLGDDKPSKQFFNWLFQTVDQKTNWLWRQLNGAAAANNVTLSEDDDTSLTTLLAQRQPQLGFVPVQQGGGVSQSAVKIALGKDATVGAVRYSYRTGASFVGAGYLISSYGSEGGVSNRTAVGDLSIDSMSRLIYTDVTLGGTYQTAALLRDVTNENTRAVAAEAGLQQDVNSRVSGTYGLGTADKKGLGLRFNNSTSNMWASYDGGGGDLAWAVSVSAEASARTAADANLSSLISACMIGSYGLQSSSSDKKVFGTRYNASTTHITIGWDGGSADLAWLADVTAEAAARAAADGNLQAGVNDKVSGSLGMATTDSKGMVLRLNGNTGKAWFGYANGNDIAGDNLAWFSDLARYCALTGFTVTGDMGATGITSWSTSSSKSSYGLILTGNNGNSISLRQNENVGQYTQAALQVLGNNGAAGYFSFRDDGTIWSGGTQFADRSWANNTFATITGLSAETARAQQAEASANANANGRLSRTGDTSTGDQNNSNNYTNGITIWGPKWSSSIKGANGGQSSGDYSFALWAQQFPGSYTGGILSLNGYQGRKDWRFNEDGNIIGPLGTVALVSSLNSEVSRAQQAEAANAASATAANNNANGRVARTGDVMSGQLTTTNNPTLASGAWNYSPSLRTNTNTRCGFRMFAQDQVNVGGSANGVLVMDWNNTDSQYWWFLPDGGINQSSKGQIAWQSQLPLPIGMHCQIFSVTIPQGTSCGIGNNPYVASLPQGFSSFSFASGSDTGSTVYTVSASPRDSSHVNIWVASPVNQSNGTSGAVVVIIYAYGYF